MSKYFFFIIATLFFQGGVIAMDQPRTPRQPISEKNTPAQKAFLLNEAINNYDFKLTRFILRQNFDPNGVSYSPAIILYEICRGNLEKSPFNSKEDWDQCQGGVIDKKAFKATALFLVDDTLNKLKKRCEIKEAQSGMRDDKSRLQEQRLLTTYRQIESLE